MYFHTSNLEEDDIEIRGRLKIVDSRQQPAWGNYMDFTFSEYLFHDILLLLK